MSAFSFLPTVSSESLDEAIFKTVAFFDVFDFPLRMQELSERLLAYEATEDEVRGVAEVSQRVHFVDGYVILPGREEIIARRQTNLACDLELWKTIQRYLWIFQAVPGVVSVSICNRLAMTQGAVESDIDIFVVAREGRMFFVRSCLLLLTHIFGVRRHDDKVSARFCLSFFVDRSSTNLERLAEGPSDIYLAYWTLLLHPVVGALDMCRENPWLAKFFSQRVLEQQRGGTASPRFSFIRLLLSVVSAGWLGDFIERRLMAWQLPRAQAKYQALGRPFGVVLSEHTLKFHDRDMRNEYLVAWEERLDRGDHPEVELAKENA